MTVQFRVALASFLLEHKHFVSFHMGNNFSADGSAFYCRHAYVHFSLVIHEKNFVEFNGVAFISFEAVNKYLLALLNLELLSCNVYYSVHFLYVLKGMRR